MDQIQYMWKRARRQVKVEGDQRPDVGWRQARRCQVNPEPPPEASSDVTEREGIAGRRADHVESGRQRPFSDLEDIGEVGVHLEVELHSHGSRGKRADPQVVVENSGEPTPEAKVQHAGGKLAPVVADQRILKLITCRGGARAASTNELPGETTHGEKVGR